MGDSPERTAAESYAILQRFLDKYGGAGTWMPRSKDLLPPGGLSLKVDHGVSDQVNRNLPSANSIPRLDREVCVSDWRGSVVFAPFAPKCDPSNLIRYRSLPCYMVLVHIIASEKDDDELFFGMLVQPMRTEDENRPRVWYVAPAVQFFGTKDGEMLDTDIMRHVMLIVGQALRNGQQIPTDDYMSSQVYLRMIGSSITEAMDKLVCLSQQGETGMDVVEIPEVPEVSTETLGILDWCQIGSYFAREDKATGLDS